MKDVSAVRQPSHRSRRRAVATIVSILALAAVQALAGPAAGAQGTTDWPNYLSDKSGDSFTPETLITPANAPSLKARPGWPVHLAGTLSAQPVVTNGFIYQGTWAGYEYALCETACNGHASGFTAWRTDLGKSSTTTCETANIGIASTAAVASVTLPGATSPTSLLFVGGGGNVVPAGLQQGASIFALDAMTGAIKWQTVLGASPATLIWSSPVVHTPTNATVPSVYIGVASFDDCPLVRGALVQLNAATGAVQHTFYTVPEGCVGGGVWGTPTIDPATGYLYVATGNADHCSVAEPNAVSVLKLRSSDLALVNHWQLPMAEWADDPDFGSVPTLFRGTVTPGGKNRALLGIPNKNGIYYVLDRNNLSAGPVARLTIAIAGGCPDCGQGSISPAAYDGQHIYVAGGTSQYGSKTVPGVLRAFDPNNLGKPLWQHALNSGPVLGAVTAAPGVVVVGEGHTMVMVGSADGKTLFSHNVNTINTTSPAIFYAPVSIAHGMVLEGDTHAYLYLYSVNGT